MKTSPRFRRGDTSPLRPGLVFYDYNNGGERWVTPSEMERQKQMSRKRVAKWAAKKKVEWDASKKTKSFARGDTQPDKPGLVFWGLWHAGRERWVTPEKFEYLRVQKNALASNWEPSEEFKERQRKLDNARAKTPRVRARQNAFQRKKQHVYGPRGRMRRRSYKAMRRATDPIFRLKANLGTRIRQGFKRQAIRKQTKCIDLLGCSYAFFKDWIGRQFEPGMTFENYGFETWHVDHVIPLCLFDLSDPVAARHAFNYRNTRPAWGKPNLSKNGRLDMALVAKHELYEWMPYVTGELKVAA